MNLDVSDFQRNLKKLSKVIKRKPEVLIFANVLLTTVEKRLYLVGTNGKTLVKIAQDYNGEQLTCLVNYHQLITLLSTHEGNVCLTIDGRKLILNSENSASELSLVNIDEYVNVNFELPELKKIDTVYFDNIVGFFNRFGKAGEKPFTKVINDNVFTDGYKRICVYNNNNIFKWNVSVLSILKMLSGSKNVYFGEDQLASYFVVDNVLVKDSKTVLEKYPTNWKDGIPETELILTLPRSIVIEKLKVLLEIDDICYILIDNDITVTVKTKNAYSEFVIPASIDTKLSLKINIRDFINVISYLGTDDVVIEVGKWKDVYMLKFLNAEWGYYMVSLV